MKCFDVYRKEAVNSNSTLYYSLVKSKHPKGISVITIEMLDSPVLTKQCIHLFSVSQNIFCQNNILICFLFLYKFIMTIKEK